MFDEYEKLGYEIEEEEFDEGYEERLAEIERLNPRENEHLNEKENYEERLGGIEKNIENIKGTLNENYNGMERNAFNRELGPPEKPYEEQYISSDDIEKMVINLDENENPELEKLNERMFGEIIDAEIESNKLGEARGINESEHLDSYYQPELVKEWEELYHTENEKNEREEFLSQEALNDLQKSMDEMQMQNQIQTENINENIVEETVEDPSKMGFHDQLEKAMDEIMSVDNNDLVSNEQEAENLDLGLDLEMGNSMQDGMSSEFDTRIGEDLDSEEDADMNTAFDIDNSS
jgi:hypothetical protein